MTEEKEKKQNQFLNKSKNKFLEERKIFLWGERRLNLHDLIIKLLSPRI